jgi:hypothetical protein
LRSGHPNRALHMEGHRLERHVAAASRADRGDNQDPAVGAASLGKAIDRENRDQTTHRCRPSLALLSMPRRAIRG